MTSLFDIINRHWCSTNDVVPIILLQL